MVKVLLLFFFCFDEIVFIRNLNSFLVKKKSEAAKNEEYFHISNLSQSFIQMNVVPYEPYLAQQNAFFHFSCR